MASQVELKFRNLEVKRFVNFAEGPVNVHNNSNVKTVSKIEGRLVIEFSFTCSFEPGIGIIKIDGDIMLRDSDENIERAMKEWDKGAKNLPTDVTERVHNAILSSCIIESVVLSKEMGLPAPIPLPTVSMSAKKEPGTQEVKTSDDTKHYIR
jgi:hypothetical protein